MLVGKGIPEDHVWDQTRGTLRLPSNMGLDLDMDKKPERQSTACIEHGELNWLSWRQDVETIQSGKA